MPDYNILLKDIERYWLDHGYPPTVRYLQNVWKVGSTSTVFYRVRHMATMGLVRHSGGMVVPRKMLEQAQKVLREGTI